MSVISDCSPPTWAVQPWRNSGRKEYLPFSSHRTVATPHGEPWGNWCENIGFWPQMAEVHTKGIISMCPDSCIVPCICVCMWGCVCVCVCVWVAQGCLILCYPMNCLWNSLGKNIGVGCHSLLHGIFPIQGSNLGLLHCRQILYHLS